MDFRACYKHVTSRTKRSLMDSQLSREQSDNISIEHLWLAAMESA